MEGPVPAEQHYAPSDIAAFWRLDVETIRRMFQDEPGVAVFQGPIKKGIRQKNLWVSTGSGNLPSE